MVSRLPSPDRLLTFRFPTRSVHLVVREHLALTLNRDGGVDSLSLKGDLDLRISDPAYATLMINLPPPASYAKGNDLQFKTHPNVDKNAWASKGEIRLKEGKKGFPVGQGLGVLKWRLTGTDESVVPISSELSPSFFASLLSLTPPLDYSQLLALGRFRHLHHLPRIRAHEPLPLATQRPHLPLPPSRRSTHHHRSTRTRRVLAQPRRPPRLGYS